MPHLISPIGNPLPISSDTISFESLDFRDMRTAPVRALFSCRPVVAAKRSMIDQVWTQVEWLDDQNQKSSPIRHNGPPLVS